MWNGIEDGNSFVMSCAALYIWMTAQWRAFVLVSVMDLNVCGPPWVLSRNLLFVCKGMILSFVLLVLTSLFTLFMQSLFAQILWQCSSLFKNVVFPHGAWVRVFLYSCAWFCVQCACGGIQGFGVTMTSSIYLYLLLYLFHHGVHLIRGMFRKDSLFMQM